MEFGLDYESFGGSRPNDPFGQRYKPRKFKRGDKIILKSKNVDLNWERSYTVQRFLDQGFVYFQEYTKRNGMRCVAVNYREDFYGTKGYFLESDIDHYKVYDIDPVDPDLFTL